MQCTADGNAGSGINGIVNDCNIGKQCWLHVQHTIPWLTDYITDTVSKTGNNVAFDLDFITKIVEGCVLIIRGKPVKYVNAERTGVPAKGTNLVIDNLDVRPWPE